MSDNLGLLSFQGIPKTKQYLYSLLAGILFSLSFSPLDLWWLPFVSIFILLYLLEKLDYKESFMVGWFFGIGVFCYGTWWLSVSIKKFGIDILLVPELLTSLFIIGMAIYFGLFGITIRYFREKLVLSPSIISFIWLMLELLRSKLFTGFPWLILGYSQLDGPLNSIFPFVGSYGCSWLVVFLVSILYKIFHSRSIATCLQCLCLFPLLILILGYCDNKTLTFPYQDTLSVSLIQGSVNQDVKWDYYQRTRNFVKYRTLSDTEWSSDLIVWPETAVTILDTDISAELAELKSRAIITNTNIVLGIPTFVDGNIYNSALNLGSGQSTYSKRHLVPFGEYFPFGTWGKLLQSTLQIPMSNLTVGESTNDSFILNDSISVGMAICYEIAFPSFVFSSIPKSGFLIHISNDDWFGDTVAPFQHLQIARVRALESGRPIIRSTNTGLTVLIDYKGNIVKQSPQFIEHVLRANVNPRKGETLYVKYRDFPIILISALLGALCLIRGAKNSNKGFSYLNKSNK